jgi:hypothetical protein
VIELIAAFAVGVAVGLGTLWPYAHSLKSSVELYKAYVHDRLDNQTAGINGHELEPRAPAESDRTSDGGPALSQLTTATRPQLIVTASAQAASISYVCSACLRTFPLSELETPKNAAAILYQTFQQHIAEDHSGFDETSAGRSVG